MREEGVPLRRRRGLHSRSMLRALPERSIASLPRQLAGAHCRKRNRRALRVASFCGRVARRERADALSVGRAMDQRGLRDLRMSGEFLIPHVI